MPRFMFAVTGPSKCADGILMGLPSNKRLELTPPELEPFI